MERAPTTWPHCSAVEGVKRGGCGVFFAATLSLGFVEMACLARG
jgi:hypothetical protein